MIELRWREVVIEIGIGYGRTDKVLQYRTWTDTTPLTPWIDVPTAPWTATDFAAHPPSAAPDKQEK